MYIIYVLIIKKKLNSKEKKYNLIIFYDFAFEYNRTFYINDDLFKKKNIKNCAFYFCLKIN